MAISSSTYYPSLHTSSPLASHAVSRTQLTVSFTGGGWQLDGELSLRQAAPPPDPPHSLASQYADKRVPFLGAGIDQVTREG